MSKVLLRSKRDLIYALMECMGEKDYATITITEICKRAGYNRSTFYKYYYEKEDLLDEAIQLKISELEKKLKSLPIPDSVVDYNQYMKKEELLTPLFQFIYENRVFFNIVLKDNKIVGFRNKMFTAYRNYIKVRFQPTIPAIQNDQLLQDLYLQFIASEWLSVVIYWIQDWAHKDVDYVTIQFIKIASLTDHSIFQQMVEEIEEIKEPVDLDPRIVRTKVAFKASLIKLLQQQQYELINIVDIAEEAGYHRTTFYSHYKVKNDLYQDVLLDLIEGMKRAMKEPYDEQGKSIQFQAIFNLFSYIYDNRRLLEIMYSDKKIPGFFNKLFSGLSDFFYKELIKIEENRVDIKIYSHYLASTLMTVIGNWFTNKVRYSPSFMATIYIEMITNDL